MIYIKILLLILLFSKGLLKSEEPVIFHFNFTLETVEPENLNIRITGNNNFPAWQKNFTEKDLVKDEYRNILLSDTIYNMESGPEPYKIEIDYLLKNKSGKNDCFFSFTYPDSVQRLALELYFDQAVIVKMEDKLLYNQICDEYMLNDNPKPALIVKYWNKLGDVVLSPTWFNGGRITVRPRYILYNTGNSIIYRKDKSMMTDFYGTLFLNRSGQDWIIYPYGGMCGTTNPIMQLEPGNSVAIVEGFPIGNPRKLKEGFYKYQTSFSYQNDAQADKIISIIDTYFNVMYAK